MTPHDLFLEARKRGLQIAAAGDKLAVMPKGACPPDFAAVLREHKGELLDWLNRPPPASVAAVSPGGCPHPGGWLPERFIDVLRTWAAFRTDPFWRDHPQLTPP